MGDSFESDNTHSASTDVKLLEELIDKSFKVKEKSYSKYSNFKVGCAVLCEDGTIVTGTNVENASFGLSMCAERSAICAAVSQGHRKFKAVVISSDMDKDFISPCGACRQFMSEFGLDIVIYMTRTDRTYVCKKLADLLPYSFTELPN